MTMPVNDPHLWVQASERSLSSLARLVPENVPPAIASSCTAERNDSNHPAFVSRLHKLSERAGNTGFEYAFSGAATGCDRDD